MIALIQRVTHAQVRVDERIVGEIGRGILAFIGVRRGDDRSAVERLLERILSYRIFPDDAGRMNRSLQAVGGGLLLVSQFTLAADTRSGTRAGFSTAATPDEARKLFDYLVERAGIVHNSGGNRVASGEFGAHMQISLINDGPVTFWLEAPAAGAAS
jgi:D-tyrosyl-tRNA(Tyr) deacylase